MIRQNIPKSKQETQLILSIPIWVILVSLPGLTAQSVDPTLL